MRAAIYQAALRLLVQREHSRYELQLKLQRKWTETDVIEDVLQALKKEGLQNDKRFAESYIRMRMARGYGPVRIAAELEERGIDSALIENCFMSADVDWSMLATVVRNKRFAHQPGEIFAEKAKQMRFLQYRGFTHDQIKVVFQKI